MSNRSLLFLLLFVLAIFLVVKFDLPTQVKIDVMNLIYGDEMRSMKKFRVVVEPLNPELEKDGLPREKVLQELTAKIEKAGIQNLAEEEWQKTPGKPTINVTVNATKTGDRLYQYSVTIEVTKSEVQHSGAYSEKIITLWTSADVGEGDVSNLRDIINEKMGFFLRAHEK
jgi:hypothetical protein